MREVLNAHGHLGGVVIEITEHRPWDWTMLAPTVNRLRNNGALFAVDDAGAGYSGLQQILQLRPSILKLDRSLVEGIDHDEAKVALVEMLGIFANRVDAWVLAEGVETMAEAKRLVELQVPLAQGYRFGRPEAPWIPLDAEVSVELADFTRVDSDTLYRLVDPVSALTQGQQLAAEWLSTSDPWVAVLDRDRRPIGLLNAEAALSGELVTTLIANVTSSPYEVAHRITTGDREPSAPVIVTDNAGRYLGLVTLRRLLGALARGSEPIA